MFNNTINKLKMILQENKVCKSGKKSGVKKVKEKNKNLIKNND